MYTHGTKMADLAHCHAMTKVVHPRVHIYTPPHTRGGSQASSQAVTALRRLSAARGRKLVLRQYFPDWCCSSENLGYSDIYGGVFFHRDGWEYCEVEDLNAAVFHADISSFLPSLNYNLNKPRYIYLKPHTFHQQYEDPARHRCCCCCCCAYGGRPRP